MELAWVVGMSLQLALIIGGLISAGSHNIRVVRSIGLVVMIVIVGLTWVVGEGETTFVVGIVLGIAIEFLIVKKHGYLQKLQELQESLRLASRL